ncbi:MAG: hypothetical protein ACOCQW_02865 [Halanaerobiaceae bacterium]
MSKKIYCEYKEIINNYPEKFYIDYIKAKEKVDNSTAIYKGESVDFLYQSLFFSEKEYFQLKILLDNLSLILNKIIEEYKKNSEFRSYFPFSNLMEELILVDPGYGVNFPMGRFDIFYSVDGNHKFCELNADGASAMNEVRVIQKVMSESLLMEFLKRKYSFRDFELFYSWIDTIINNYKRFNNGIDDKPNIAIVDFTGEGTIYEFKEFQKRFIERGYKTIICDPGELIYKSGKLLYNDMEIGLVYRRATTSRLVEEADKIPDFLEAYRNGAVCVVGGMVSQLIHNKVLFAIMHDKDKVNFLEQWELEFIKKHIPYTGIMDFKDKELIMTIIENKDKWILKPFDRYAAKGVYVGRDFNKSEWEKLIYSLENQDYIVQEYITVPEYDMLNINKQEESIYWENFGYLLGLYTYNSQLAGLYTRAGRRKIIGAAAESFTVPNYIYREDSR